MHSIGHTVFVECKPDVVKVDIQTDDIFQLEENVDVRTKCQTSQEIMIAAAKAGRRSTQMKKAKKICEENTGEKNGRKRRTETSTFQ